MKKNILLLMVVFTAITTHAQSANDVNIQPEIILGFYDALKLLWLYVNKLFMVAFIIMAGIINMYAKATNKAEKLNFLNRFTSLWILLFGFILAGFFWWVFDYRSKLDVIGLVLAIFLSMGIYKLFGFDKILKWVSTTFFKIEIKK